MEIHDKGISKMKTLNPKTIKSIPSPSTSKKAKGLELIQKLTKLQHILISTPS